MTVPLADWAKLPTGDHSFRIPPVQDIGKLLFFLGIALAVIGAILWKTGGLGWLGRLPGDIFVQKGNTTFSFPIVTCILLSLALTLLSWLFRR